MAIRIRIIDVQREPCKVKELADLITESTMDYKCSRGGHIPDWVVDDVMHKKLSTVKTIGETFKDTTYRFGLFDGELLVATILVTKLKDHLVIADNSETMNAELKDFPHYAPFGYHNAGQFVTRKGFRGRGYAKRLLESLPKEFGHLFAGSKGLSMRADPPYHDAYIRLGLIHLTAYDRFLGKSKNLPDSFKSVEEFNEKYLCNCERALGQVEISKEQRIKYNMFVYRI